MMAGRQIRNGLFDSFPGHSYPGHAPMSDINSRFEAAVRWAREAGQRTLRYFQSAHLQVERKSDQSPVTIADRDAESFLRERIAADFPDDAIVGEEFSDRAGSSSFRWILDPIDGTKSFIHGVPLYGTLIGVEQDDESRIGVIEIPALDERVYACAGGGAWHQRAARDPEPANVSSVARLDESLLVTSEVQTFTTRGAANVFTQLDQRVRLARTWGDCYGYLLVATGRAEVMIDPLLNVWDAAAVLPVIEEAGGRFTDWRGVRSVRSGDGFGSNGRLHDSVLAVTRAEPPPE
jgi:histidinol phosphatase-like enzyme (inositol monophosphatase family)